MSDWMTRSARLGLLATTAMATMSGAAWAQTKAFNVPAQAAGPGVAEFARQADVQVLLSGDDAAGRTTNRLLGAYPVEEALKRLLDRTGLTASTTAPHTYVVRAERLAQAEEVETPAQVQEIIVTATKRSERLQDVPISITAETGKDLAHRGASGIRDIVASTPGLYNAGAGEGVNNNLIIRGISTGADPGLRQASTSLLLDDIELNPGSVALNNANPKIVDVERIEVLRGPQGTLFGSGSLSGAVRFISNKPDLHQVSTSVEATASTTRNGANSYSVTGVANLPLVEDKLALRVVGYDYDTGGWVDNAYFKDKDVNGERTAGGRLALAARPTDDLQINFTAIGEQAHQLGTSASFYSPQTGVADYRRAQDRYSTQNDSRLDSQIYNLVGAYSPDWGTFTSSTSYFKRTTRTYNDYGFWVSLLSLLGGVSGLDATADSVQSNHTEGLSQEFRLESAAHGPLRWSVGAFYQKLRVGGGQQIVSDSVTPLLGVPLIAGLDTVSNQTEAAVFGTATYTLGDRFDLTAGLRLGRNKLNFSTVSNGWLFSGSATQFVETVGRQNQSTTNPRLALVFRQTPDLTWYAQASKGFRSGGPNLTAGLAGGAIPSSYSSDSLWNYEVGGKSRLLGGALRLNGALYYIDWSNIQVGLVSNATGYTGNAGDAKAYGFELEAAAIPSSWLEIGGSLSLSHGELTRDVTNLSRVTGQVGVKSGERLPATPQVQVSAYAEGSFRLRGREAYVRLSPQYVGAAYTDFGRQGLKFGDYYAMDVRAGVKLDAVEVAAFVNNLFDGQGRTSAADLMGSGPIVAFPDLAYRIRPRTVGVTFRANF